MSSGCRQRHHAKTSTSQKIKPKKHSRQHLNFTSETRGGFSDYKFNREGIDLLLACFRFYHTPKKSFCTDCISVTKVASHLQKWIFGYKSCVSLTNIQFSFYKVAFCVTKLHLALQLSQLAVFGTFFRFPTFTLLNCGKFSEDITFFSCYMTRNGTYFNDKIGLR